MGKHAGQPAFAINRMVILIGSRSSCHIHLLSPDISQIHAVLVRSAHGVYVRDLASRTHVFVNGRQIHEASLAQGDLLKIGPFLFKYEAPSDQSLLDPSPPAADAVLKIQGVDEPVVLRDRVCLIGRKSGCDVRLTEESASHTHAMVFEVDGKRYIRDLGSRTGTWLEGKSIHQSEINIGQGFHIGQTDFIYVRSLNEDELEHLVGTAPLVSEQVLVPPPAFKPPPPKPQPIAVEEPLPLDEEESLELRPEIPVEVKGPPTVRDLDEPLVQSRQENDRVHSYRETPKEEFSEEDINSLLLAPETKPEIPELPVEPQRPLPRRGWRSSLTEETAINEKMESPSPSIPPVIAEPTKTEAMQTELPLSTAPPQPLSIEPAAETDLPVEQAPSVVESPPEPVAEPAILPAEPVQTVSIMETPPPAPVSEITPPPPPSAPPVEVIAPPPASPPAVSHVAPTIPASPVPQYPQPVRPPKPPAPPAQPAAQNVSFFGWGANSTGFLGGQALQLEEIAPPPTNFGKVQVAFGNKEENPFSPPAPPPVTADDPFKRVIEKAGEFATAPAPEPIIYRDTINITSDAAPESLLFRVVPPPAARRTRVSQTIAAPAEDQVEMDGDGITAYGFGDDLPYNATPSVFEGLAGPSMREVDVFSEIGEPEEDPFFAEKQAHFSNSGAEAPPDTTSRDEAEIPPIPHIPPVSATGDIPEIKPVRAMPLSPAIQKAVAPIRVFDHGGDSLQPERTPVVYSNAPATTHARKRNLLLSVPGLMGMMLLCMGAAAGAIWTTLAPKSMVEATLEYRHFENLTQRERNFFEDDQKKRLANDTVRIVARTILNEEHKDLTLGFLEDSMEYSRRLNVAQWKGNNRGLYTVSCPSNDESGDPVRFAVLLESLFRANQDLVDKSLTVKADLKRQEETIARMREQSQQLKDQIDGSRETGENKSITEKISKLEKEAGELENKWNEAAVAVKNLQAELEQARRASSGKPATRAVAGDDATLSVMQKQVDALAVQLAEARSARDKRTAEARSAMDLAITQFQLQVEEAQKSIKDNPQLAAYLDAAQKLQQTARQLTGELIDRQQKRQEWLSEWKRQLAERMESRKNEAWKNDKELQDLRKQLELTTRQYNAAMGNKEVVDKSELEILKSDMQRLPVQIKVRESMLSDDKYFADVVEQLQQFIEQTHKQIEADRNQTENILETLQKSFAAALPAVEKLPTEQKTLAENLARRVDDMSAARKQYANLLGAGGEDSAAIGKLESDLSAVQAKVQQRKEELAQSSAAPLSEQEELARLKSLDEKRVKLASAQKAEEDARRAYWTKQQEIIRAQTAVEQARLSGDALQKIIERKRIIDDELEKRVKVLEALRSDERLTIDPRQPESRDVQFKTKRDFRGLGIAGSSIFIAAIFSLLIFMTHFVGRGSRNVPAAKPITSPYLQSSSASAPASSEPDRDEQSTDQLTVEQQSTDPFAEISHDMVPIVAEQHHEAPPSATDNVVTLDSLPDEEHPHPDQT